MDLEKIYAQYQKYIAVAERMSLHKSPAREPVLAGSDDISPSPDLAELESTTPEAGRQEIWRPIDAEEVLTRMRLTRN